MSLKFFFIFLFIPNPIRALTIMLDPAGDARTPGHTIEQHFERGITLQLAERIKKTLEQTNAYEPSSHVRVILTRIPGETVAPMQNAIFANRLEVDLYLSIHCFHAKDGKASVAMYQFLTNPITDLWATPRALSFYPYDQAHLYQVHTSKKYAEQMKEQLLSMKPAEIKGVFGIPFAPLIGIKVPAVAVEIGLRSKDEWERYIDVLAQCLKNIL